MKIRNNLPNFITLLNLLSGGIAVIMVFSGELRCAAWFILLAAVLDFLDGMFARILNARSEIGGQLDSLADVISFGLAPAAILYKLMLSSPGNPALSVSGFALLPFLGLLVAASGAYRLARFNTDSSQQLEFKGLPIPASGIFVASLPLVIKYSGEASFWPYLVTDIYFLAGVAIGLSALMVSTIPMLSLKWKNLGWRGNSSRYILLASSVVLLVLMQFAALPVIIILYVILSIVFLSFKSHNSHRI